MKGKKKETQKARGGGQGEEKKKGGNIRLRKYCQNENDGKNETVPDKTRRKDEGQKRWERKGGDISRCAGREGGKGNLFWRGTEQNVTQAKNRGRGGKAAERIYITGELKGQLKVWCWRGQADKLTMEVNPSNAVTDWRVHSWKQSR